MRLRALLVVLVASACAARGGGGSQREANGAGNVPDDVAPIPALAGADPGLEADLQRAISLVQAGDEQATPALEAIARRPANPYHDLALALLMRQALLHGDAERARAMAADRDVAEPAVRFLAAVAAARVGQGEAALSALAPWKESGAPNLAGVSVLEMKLTLSAAWGLAAGATGRFEEAFEAWEDYFDLGSDIEKLFAQRQAENLAGRLGPDLALDLYEDSSGTVARLALGPRASPALVAQGKPDAAKDIDETVRSLRATLPSTALAEAQSSLTGSGDPSRLGLLVPLSGQALPLGIAIARGAMAAIGPQPAAGGSIDGFQVILRDSSGGHSGASGAAGELAREEAVIGMLGVSDNAAIERMARDGVPYLVLGDQTPGANTTAFPLIHTPQARITALVNQASARGARRFAILRPSDALAAESAAAFRSAVAAGGGEVSAEITYPPEATTFSKEVAALTRSHFHALFIPEDAQRLELLAPALAVGDLWSRAEIDVKPGGEKGRGDDKRRSILLLSTARGLSRRLVQQTGRYVQGALLAPGFFADQASPHAGRFVKVFRELYGHDPAASDAFGFDGIHLLRTCVERGAVVRADMVRMLASGEIQGVTGKIRFGPDHARADPALVYQVSGNDIRALP